MEILALTPVLNGAAFLDAAIRSVRAQTHDRWRLVILDGGSTDGSQDIALAHADEDVRITLHAQADSGMYDALRKGFERESENADMVCWLNSDDLYTPWAFAEVAAAHADGHNWVSGLPGLWDGQGRLRAVLPRGAVYRRDIVAGRHHDGFLGAIQQESVFFARTLFDALTPEEWAVFSAQTLAGDFHLWRCFARRAPLHVTPTVLGGFRLHGRNRSRRFAEAYRLELEALGATAPKSRLVRRILRRIRDIRAAISAATIFERAALKLNEELTDKAGPA